MAKFLGANLSELLRHGAQYGLGVQEAGRQNAVSQQQADVARRKEETEALLAQAMLDEREAGAERDRAYSQSLLMPKPDETNWQTLDTAGGYMQIHPRTGQTRPVPGPGGQLKPRLTVREPPEPTEGALAYNRRLKALQDAGVTGPEAGALASDETLFRSWYGQQHGVGGDETGERQRVMNAAKALEKLRTERASLFTSGQLAKNSAAAASVLQTYGFDSIEALREAMRNLGSTGQATPPSPILEDPLGIR